MASIPLPSSDLAIDPVIPAPAAAFSPLAITKSSPSSVRRRGSFRATMSRPGRPTMSPMNRSFSMPAHSQAPAAHNSMLFSARIAVCRPADSRPPDGPLPACLDGPAGL